MELLVQFRQNELVVSGERGLCLNGKPTQRKDFFLNHNVLREGLNMCSAVFTVILQLSVSFCPSSLHMDDALYCKRDLPRMEERARTNPSCQLILLDIICLCCMELICKCKFSSYCFLNYTWLLVIAEVCSSDILIKSWCVDVFIYLHTKKRVLLSAFKGPFLIQNIIV